MMREPINPRVLQRDEAARYVGYTKANAASDAYIHKRLGVKPLPNRPGRYDRHALDAALDRISGISTNPALTEVDEWFQKLDREREAQKWLDSQ